MARYRSPGVCGVYVFRRRRDGACLYIGSSVNVQVRHKAHLAHLRSGVHHSRGLQRFWDKYGSVGLDFEIIQTVIRAADLRACECQVIAELRPLFNSVRSDLASGPMRHSPETIEKMRRSHLGHKRPPGSGAKAAATRRSAFTDGVIRLTQEHIAKVAAANIGKVIPPSSREKMRAAKLGKPQTKEHTAKISAALKGRPTSSEHRRKLALGALRQWNVSPPSQLNFFGDEDGTR